MRDIKFRAWHVKEGNMIPDVGVFPSTDRPPPWCISGDGIIVHPAKAAEDLVLMQYTGLKDKNGVVIYAEDIVLWEEVFPGNVIKIVRWGGPWNYAAFGLTGPRKTPRMNDDTKDTWDLLTPNLAAHCEIIGNTKENPELAPVEDPEA